MFLVLKDLKGSRGLQGLRAQLDQWDLKARLVRKENKENKGHQAIHVRQSSLFRMTQKATPLAGIPLLLALCLVSL
jgi:hypothetical protein